MQKSVIQVDFKSFKKLAGITFLSLQFSKITTHSAAVRFFSRSALGITESLCCYKLYFLSQSVMLAGAIPFFTLYIRGQLCPAIAFYTGYSIGNFKFGRSSKFSYVPVLLYTVLRVHVHECIPSCICPMLYHMTISKMIKN